MQAARLTCVTPFDVRCRKLPKATIILGCWMKDMDLAALKKLRDGAKADPLLRAWAKRLNYVLRRRV
jgi:hypothetical protein